MESGYFSAHLNAPRRLLRGALGCALLLHGLVIGVWQGSAVPQQVVTPAASLIAVSLQTTAMAAPKSVVRPAPPRERVLPKPAPQQHNPAPVQPPKKVLSQTPIETVAARSQLSIPVQTSTAESKPAAVESKPAAAVSASNETQNSPAKAKTSPEHDGEGKVTPAQYSPAYLNNPKPVMSFISIKNGESGVVRLRVKVSAKGEPLLVTIEKSSGFPRLDQTAYKTVKDLWRFVPAKRGDTSIESEVAFNIPFILQDAE